MSSKENLRAVQFLFRFLGLLLRQNAVCKSCQVATCGAAIGLTQSTYRWASSVQVSSENFTQSWEKFNWLHRGLQSDFLNAHWNYTVKNWNVETEVLCFSFCWLVKLTCFSPPQIQKAETQTFHALRVMVLPVVSCRVLPHAVQGTAVGLLAPTKSIMQTHSPGKVIILSYNDRNNKYCFET